MLVAIFANVLAVSAFGAQLSLAWTDNSSNETGFKIERSTDNFASTNVLVTTVAANVTNYVDTGLAASTQYWYRIRATNAGGDSTNSNVGSGTTPAAAIPVITSSGSGSGTSGIAFSYTITATNTPTSFNATGLPTGLAINTSSGAITGTPTVIGTFSVTLSATNASGTGNAALSLTISASAPSAPVITSTTSASGTVGAIFSYAITATNSPTSFNATGLPGGLSINTSSGAITGTPSAPGSYSVNLTATNGSGTGGATLSLAINSVVGATTGRLVNLSVRTGAGTGDSTLIVGLVIGGSGTVGTKPLLVRGVGPTLTTYGVPGALADSTLEFLLQGSTIPIATNDNWVGDATIKAVANAVGAAPLSADSSKDAALYLSPAKGIYSVKVGGVGGTTGIGLAEIYDASGFAYTAATPRLINVSARAQVGTGDGVLIAGFVIGGSTPCRVLIRAVGPTLANYGVGGTLADPQLELTQAVTGSNVVVATNDDWHGDAQISAAANAVGASALASTTSKDSAILVSLQPGIYAAKASGVGGTTGVALIEVYEAP